MAWPYLCGRVLPLPIGDWVQGCVSRLQAALRAWPNTLDIKVVAQGEDSTEKASGTARACRGAFTVTAKKKNTQNQKKQQKKRKRQLGKPGLESPAGNREASRSIPEHNALGNQGSGSGTWAAPRRQGAYAHACRGALPLCRQSPEQEAWGRERTQLPVGTEGDCCSQFSRIRGMSG